MVEPEAWMRSGRCRPQGSKGRRSVSWRCRQSRMIHGCGVRPKPSIAPAGGSSRLVCRERARLHRYSHPDSREPPRSYRPTPPALALNMAVDFDDAKLTKQLKAAAILSEETKKNPNHPGHRPLLDPQLRFRAAGGDVRRDREPAAACEIRPQGKLY